MKENLIVLEKMLKNLKLLEPITKEIGRINLLTVQDLCQVRHQILLIIFLNEFIKLNANMDMGHDNKKCKTCGIKYKDCEGCLKYNNIKDDLIPNKF